MLKPLRFWDVGWLAGGSVLVAMAATMIVAAPSAATTPEKEYPSSSPAPKTRTR